MNNEKFNKVGDILQKRLSKKYDEVRVIIKDKSEMYHASLNVYANNLNARGLRIDNFEIQFDTTNNTQFLYDVGYFGIDVNKTPLSIANQLMNNIKKYK